MPGSSSLSSSLGSSKNRRSWHPPSGLAMPRCLDVDGELTPGGGRFFWPIAVEGLYLSVPPKPAFVLGVAFLHAHIPMMGKCLVRV